ncbi:hypothetical protein NMG60_11000390 [Bertholletia excelsa]
MASAPVSNQSCNTATNDGRDVTASSSYFLKTVCLQDWWLIKAEEDFEGRRLAIAGLTSREHHQAVRVFSSAPILKRYDVFTLETVDGVCVLIKGFINKDRTKENGFPLEVFKHFVFGFPAYWEEYAHKWLGGGISNQDVSRSALGSDQLSVDSGGVNYFGEGSPNGNKKVTNGEQNDNSYNMDFYSKDRRNMFSETGPHEHQDDPCNVASVEDPNIHSSHTITSCNMTSISKSDDRDNKKTAVVSQKNESEKFIILDGNINLNSASKETLQKNSDINNFHSCKFAETVHVNSSGLSTISSGKKPRNSEKNDNEVDKDALGSRDASISTSSPSTRPGVIINDVEKLAVGGGSTSSASDPREAQKKSASTRPTIKSSHVLGDSKTSLDDTMTIAKKQLTSEKSPRATTVNTKSSNSGLKNLRLGERMKQAARCCLKYKDRNRTPASEACEDLDKQKQNCISEVRRTAWSKDEEDILDKSPSECRRRKYQGQHKQGITSKAGKETKSMNRTTRYSIWHADDANKNSDLPTAVGKKETNAKKESNSGNKTKRKLTYESPTTRRGTEKTSFVSPESLNIKRSRSGRLLLPTLEFWRNQVAVYDVNRQITGIREGDCGVEPSRGSRSEPPRKRS